jgi:hypothetical protein
VNHDPLTDVSDLHPVTPDVREVLDLLGIDPGHHPSVRLPRADWARVSAVAARIAQPEKEPRP